MNLMISQEKTFKRVPITKLWNTSYDVNVFTWTGLVINAKENFDGIDLHFTGQFVLNLDVIEFF